MVWYTHVVASIRHVIVKQGVGEVDKADENDFILPDELKRKAFFSWRGDVNEYKK